MSADSELTKRRRVVILAGGKGTRLRPYTTVLPKPLMPIGDRPILDIILRQLKYYGFEHVTIACGYLAELIEAFFGDGSNWDLAIDYHRESEPLGTAGALSTIDGLDDSFLVMNGDVLTDIDYRKLFEAHCSSDACATIATHRRDVEVAFGIMRFDDEDGSPRLTGYEEKPTLSYEVSMGVYCFSPAIREFVEPNVYLDFPDLILKLVAHGEIVRGWRSDAYWLDIGRHDDYETANDEFEAIRDRLLPRE